MHFSASQHVGQNAQSMYLIKEHSFVSTISTMLSIRQFVYCTTGGRAGGKENKHHKPPTPRPPHPHRPTVYLFQYTNNPSLNSVRKTKVAKLLSSANSAPLLFEWIVSSIIAHLSPSMAGVTWQPQRYRVPVQ